MYVYLGWDLKLCMVEIRYGKVCSNTNYYIHYNPNSFESHYMVCLPFCSTVCFYVFGNFWESKVRRPPTINKEIKGVVLKPLDPVYPHDPSTFARFVSSVHRNCHSSQSQPITHTILYADVDYHASHITTQGTRQNIHTWYTRSKPCVIG